MSVGGPDLQSCGLMNSISTVALGASTTANYFNGPNFDSWNAWANYKSPSMVGLWYPNSSPRTLANDHVSSIIIYSTTADKPVLPADCAAKRYTYLDYDR